MAITSQLESPDDPMRPPLGAVTKVPHARAVPFLGSIPFYFYDPLRYLRTAANLGDIVEIRVPNQPTFLLSQPADIEQVLVTANRSFVKDIFTRDLRRVVGEGLLTSDGDFWRRQRRLAQPAFHRDRLRAYAAQMVRSAQHCAAGFRDGEVRDLHEDLMHVTLDVVTRTLFSSSVGDDGAAVGAAVDTIMDYYANPLVTVVPRFYRLPLPINRRFRDAVRRLNAIIYLIIGERRANDTRDRGDLLSMLLSAQDQDGSRMTDLQLRDEVMTLFLAGHETTANALSWAFLLLAQNPSEDARLAAEIAAEVGERAPTLDDLPRLAHAERVVTEAMRLYPPAWLMAREVAEPFDLRGVTFAKRTQLWMSPFVMHRDRRYFEAPESFRPDRWTDGLAKRLPRFAYFPFGGGPRLCIGNAFAMMEATLVLATIAQRFRFELAPRARAVPLPSVTLRPRFGLKMRVVARN